MLTLGAYFHALNPVVLPISGDFAVRWYGLSYLAGFLIAWALLRTMARRAWIRLPVESVSDFLFSIILGTFVGGRLGYAIIYEPSLFISFDSSFPFWGLLQVNRGGMASHGGMIGLTIAALLFARRARLPMLHLMDAIGLVAPPGLLLGRIANFVNGELLGRIVSPPGATAPWWSVKYPQELLERPPELSVDQRFELESLLAGAAPGAESRRDAIETVLYKVQHGDAQLARALEPLISARHPSQIYQAAAEGVVLFVVLWLIARRKRRPGVIAAWFFIVYGIGRITTEFWRLPDAGLVHERIAGLSRGQWLSAFMVIVGAALLIIVSRRNTGPASERMTGGWGLPRDAKSL